MAFNDFNKLAKRLTQSVRIISTINPILSIKSGKTVGSGKVVLLIFLTVLISRQKAISVFSLNGLAVMVFNLLILDAR